MESLEIKTSLAHISFATIVVVDCLIKGTIYYNAEVMVVLSLNNTIQGINHCIIIISE